MLRKQPRHKFDWLSIGISGVDSIEMREVVMLSDSSWCPQDLFFMGDSIRRGSSFGEVAGFLSRTEEEVRRKAEELGIKQCLGIAVAGHERRMGN
jgi:hypothetical protein